MSKSTTPGTTPVKLNVGVDPEPAPAQVAADAPSRTGDKSTATLREKNGTRATHDPGPSELASKSTDTPPMARPLGTVASSEPQPTGAPDSKPRRRSSSDKKNPHAPDAKDAVVRTSGWRRLMLRQSPSWLTSLLIHMVVLIVLGIRFLPELPALVIATLEVSRVQEQPEELEELVEFETEVPQLEAETAMELEEQPATSLVEDQIDFSPAADLEAAAAPETELLDIGVETAPLLASTDALGIGGSAFSGRGHMARAVMVRKGGGNEASETAVSLALQWLARHQNPDGSWSFDHTQGACQGRCKNPGSLNTAFSGGTAMALLPFLGAGQTHTSGDYQEVVAAGLAALVRQMKPAKIGGSFVDSGNLYSHGLAAIALCEAFGMTDDPQLQQAAQLALDFISYAQDPLGGGWRYQIQQPGDTSVVGWQIMALKSGHISYLQVPPSTVQKASLFLDSVQTDGGAGYSYTNAPLDYKPSTSSIGLLCRMYLGWDRDNPVLAEGVRRLAEIGPSPVDSYYNYYATQVLFQFTDAKGEMWDAWNTKMRDQLVVTQAKEGHERGSWWFDGGHSGHGGRVYCTAMSCMTLEVYYRHMPLYRTETVEAEFPE
jgi:hypothetical protein